MLMKWCLLASTVSGKLLPRFVSLKLYCEPVWRHGGRQSQENSGVLSPAFVAGAGPAFCGRARPDHFPDCPRSGSVSSRVVTLHVPRCRRCSTDAYSRRLLGMRRASKLTLRVMIRTLSGKLSWVLAGFARLLRPEPWSVYRWSVKLRAKAPRRVYGPGTPAPPPRLLLSDRSASGAAGGGGGTQQTHPVILTPPQTAFRPSSQPPTTWITFICNAFLFKVLSFCTSGKRSRSEERHNSTEIVL